MEGCGSASSSVASIFSCASVVSGDLCTWLQYLDDSVRKCSFFPPQPKNSLFCLGVVFHLEDVDLQRLFVLPHQEQNDSLRLVKRRI